MCRAASLAKASLTATAEDKSKTFGQSDPSFTVSILCLCWVRQCWFVGRPGWCSASPGSRRRAHHYTARRLTVPTGDAGVYAIRPSGLASDDSTASPTGPAPTRSAKADQAITALPRLADKTYGDDDFDLDASGGGSGESGRVRGKVGECTVVMSGPKPV